MGETITLVAGSDKLIIERAENDWCPVYVVTPSKKMLLGKGGWKHIAQKWLLKSLKASFDKKVSEPKGVLMLSDPHGAAYIENHGDHDIVFFQGEDAPRVFHSMILSRMEKQQWIDILQKELQG